MCRRQSVVMVLDDVKVLDQQVAAARRITKKRPDLLERHLIDLAPLDVVLGFASTATGMAEAFDLHVGLRARHGLTHLRQ